MIDPQWFETVGIVHMRRFCRMAGFAAKAAKERGWDVSADDLLKGYHIIFRGEKYGHESMSRAHIERNRRRRAAQMVEVEA
ncbi:MAG: hypothetical protein C6W55_10415 [Thermobacillus sp.]|nr:MAG: hypothetical protein C6W55_10415 [Thermobacillus sp.]